VAEAYAFVHLLERYRRFWAVLEALMKAGTLPMRDTGIDVLDVGVGPGPALYATSDFYELLNFYADSGGIAGLRTPSPKLHAIEESTNMVHVIHRISEVRGRAGRFDHDLDNFEGVNFEFLRAARLEKIIASLENGDVAGESLFDLLDWQDESRFNFGIFSYFLTEEEVVKTTASALQSLFRSMRAGGIVVIIGAVAGKYRKIYKGVARIAKHELMQRIMAKHSRIPCISADMYIKPLLSGETSAVSAQAM
jgi:ribosomal protein RSM22 (predicted rRNA methylase)